MPQPDPRAVTAETGYAFVSTFMQPCNVGMVDAKGVFELQENMFIRIANPRPSSMVNGVLKEGDVTYAQKILQNWGKQTGTVNEVRELCGLEGISVDEMVEMAREWDGMESREK